MAWPYAFQSLSNEEKAHRRELLDWYGAFAQLSTLFPLLVLQLYFFVSWLRRRARNSNSFDTPSSPRIKEANGRGESWEGKVRRMRWWLGGKVVLPGGEVVGTRGQVVGAVGWGVWSVVLCFWDTGQDYLHLTKRFGIISASQLPFHYLLALKSPYSPLQYLTGRSHESLNTLHQLLGRVITILVYAHAGLYLNFYIQSNLLAEKVQEAYVICGILGVTAFTVVGTTALGPVRRWSYRVFYVTHVVLATLLLPVLWFHVSHLRVYLYETAAVYAVNVILRGLSSKTVNASLRVLENGTLVEVTIPLMAGLGKETKVLRNYQPGQHAYLSMPGHPASRTFRSNPFSVASVPAVDNELRFVARILDGNTAALSAIAGSSSKHEITIEGPYGLATHAENLLQFDRVLFVAGGVGGTFIAPLYRQLLADLSPSSGSYRRQKVSFAWIARSSEDVAWAMPRDKGERKGFVERLQVWTTQASGHSRGHDRMDVVSSYAGDEDEGIELQESKGLLSQGNDGLDGNVTTADLTVRSGRPDVRRLLAETCSHGAHERLAVVVCGPSSLSRALRDDVGVWVASGRELWFWDENFGL